MRDPEMWTEVIMETEAVLDKIMKLLEEKKFLEAGEEFEKEHRRLLGIVGKHCCEEGDLSRMFFARILYLACLLGGKKLYIDISNKIDELYEDEEEYEYEDEEGEIATGSNDYLRWTSQEIMILTVALEDDLLARLKVLSKMDEIQIMEEVRKKVRK